MRFSRWRFPLALLILAVFIALFCLHGGDWISLRKTVLASQLSTDIAYFGEKLVLLCAVLFLTLVFGRWYCAVACPAGTTQDLFTRLGRMAGLSRLRFARPPFAVNLLALAAAAVFAGVVALDPAALFGWFALPLGGFVNNGMWGVSRLFSSVVPALAAWAVVLLLLAAVPFFFGRVYCDALCPVGTLLRFAAMLPGKRMIMTAEKCVSCGRCEKACPARCVDAGGKTVDGARCLLCLECVNVCRAGALAYAPAGTAAGRRGFLGGVGMGLLGAGYAAAREVKQRMGIGYADASRTAPPGTGGLARHAQRCVGCQACVLACPVGILRADGTDVRPLLDYRHGYCQYNCVDCAASCPAGAFDAIGLEEKQRTRLARVELAEERCVVRTRGEACGACAEVCPTHAVTMRPQGEGMPTVPDFSREHCIGCGACYHVCPVEPRAFVVTGLAEHEASAGVRLVETPAPGEGDASAAPPDEPVDFPF